MEIVLSHCFPFVEVFKASKEAEAQVKTLFLKEHKYNIILFFTSSSCFAKYVYTQTSQHIAEHHCNTSTAKKEIKMLNYNILQGATQAHLEIPDNPGQALEVTFQHQTKKFH